MQNFWQDVGISIIVVLYFNNILLVYVKEEQNQTEQHFWTLKLFDNWQLVNREMQIIYDIVRYVAKCFSLFHVIPYTKGTGNTNRFELAKQWFYHFSYFFSIREYCKICITNLISLEIKLAQLMETFWTPVLLTQDIKL